jgi:hypothetical protein
VDHCLDGVERARNGLKGLPAGVQEAPRQIPGRSRRYSSSRKALALGVECLAGVPPGRIGQVGPQPLEPLRRMDDADQPLAVPGPEAGLRSDAGAKSQPRLGRPEPPELPERSLHLSISAELQWRSAWPMELLRRPGTAATGPAAHPPWSGGKFSRSKSKSSLEISERSPYITWMIGCRPPAAGALPGWVTSKPSGSTATASASAC